MAIADVSERSLTSLLSFADRVVVITGGASGIGRAAGRRFAEAGAAALLADAGDLVLEMRGARPRCSHA